MKKLLAICTILVFLAASTAVAETQNPLVGTWTATRMITDGQDMDLTGVFKDFVLASINLDASNTFNLSVTMFGNTEKTHGNYVITAAGKLTFYADGNLSAGTYSFEGATLILEESVNGKACMLYLEIDVYEIGGIMVFGSYEQDNNIANGKEPIVWIILYKQADGSLVLVSKYALDCKKYNKKLTDVTWESCTLRKWLNKDYYRAAFSAQEQAKIKTVHLLNEDNPYHGTTGGKDTDDKVWLLSINEVTDRFSKDKLYTYFADDTVRMCAPTKYAVAQGALQSSDYTVDGAGACWWWLRSPGDESRSAARVLDVGYVNYYGNYVDVDNDSVRPVVVVLP